MKMDDAATQSQVNRSEFGVAEPSIHTLRSARRKFYFRALWSGGALRVVNIVTQMLMVSLTVRYLEKERYGVWTMISTVVSWFALANLGLGNGLISRLSSLQGVKHAEEARRAAFSAVSLIFVVSLVIAAPALWISSILPWSRMLNVESTSTAMEVLPTVLAGIAIVLAMLPLTAGAAILTGHQRSDLVNITNICGSVGGLVVLLIAIHFRVSMPSLFAALMLPQFLAMAAQYWIAARIGYIRFSLRYFDGPEARRLLSLGSRFLTTQLFSILIFESNAFIIAHRFGAAEVTPYGVTYRLSMFIITVFGVVMVPLWPAYGEAISRGDFEWARRVFFKSIVVVAGLWAAFALVLGVGGRMIVSIWVGPEAVPSWLLLWAMLFFTLAFGIAQSVVYPLNGIGKINAQLLAGVITAALNIPLALWLSRYWGVSGVVVSQALLLIVVAIPLQAWALLRLLRSDQPRSAVNAH